jgi:hypothetical protein
MLIISVGILASSSALAMSASSSGMEKLDWAVPDITNNS